MRYICSWSGGKDSTASIILAHLHGEPLDTILCSEVMFDKLRNISGENPEHMDFIRNVAKPLFESWGYEVLILHAEKDFLDCFNHVIKRATTCQEHNGMTYGFPISRRCSIKRDCKIKPVHAYLKSLKEDYVNYQGICIDEPLRLVSMHKNDSHSISLLEKYQFTEEMAMQLCMEHGLLSPLYLISEKQHRQGCWFCPNAKLEEHLQIKLRYPEIWKEYIDLEDREVAFNNWNVYSSKTLHQRDKLLDEIIEKGECKE